MFEHKSNERVNTTPTFLMQLRPNDKILRFFMPARGMIRSMQFVDKDNCLSRGARDARKKITRGAQINKGVTCPRPKIYRRSTNKLGLLARERKIARNTIDCARTQNGKRGRSLFGIPLQPREELDTGGSYPEYVCCKDRPACIDSLDCLHALIAWIAKQHVARSANHSCVDWVPDATGDFLISYTL